MLFVLFTEAPKTAGTAESDFMCYYVAAQLFLRGNSPYDPAAQDRLRSQLTGSATVSDPQVSYVYPPAFLLLVLPFTAMPVRTATVAWTLLQVAVLYFVVGRQLQKELTLPGWMIVLSFLITWLPVFAALKFGQISIILLALFLAFAGALKKERQAEAGIWLAGLCIKPTLLLVPLLVLAFSKRWKILCWCFLSLGVLAITGLFMVGEPGIRAYVSALQLAALRQAPGGLFRSSTYSWAVVTGPLGNYELPALLGLDFVTVLACMAAVKLRGIRAATGTVALSSTLVSIHVLVHDLSLWVAAVPDVLQRRPALGIPALVLLFVNAWIAHVGFGNPQLMVYTGVAVLLLLLFSPASIALPVTHAQQEDG